MKNRLKDYFPAVWTAEEWEEQLQKNQEQQRVFEQWEPEEQKEFLDFCTGKEGLNVLQREFFRSVMNEDRLRSFLSELFGKKIRWLHRGEGGRADLDYACLDTDLQLEFEDGEEAVVEIWKTGAAFSSQQYAFRSAQLLTDQCRKKRQKKGKKFRIRKTGKACMVLLFENCPVRSGSSPGTYIHRGKVCFDTGAELEFLQEYYLLDLDFQGEERKEKNIPTELEGWMTFLGCRHPEKIVQLIKTYPYFKGMYEELYGICRKEEKVLDMFSSEIKRREEELSRRTMEEMEEAILRLTRQHEEDCSSLELLKRENRQKEEKITGQYQEAMRRIEELEKMLGHV